MIQNSRYFFYGCPAKYALVGQEDQHIWLVLDNLALARIISQVFESKITTVVFDLTTFENYTPELIDNSVCFDWQVPVNALHDVKVLATNDQKINSIIYTGEGTQLKNIVQHDILLLSKARCQELQQQLMCIYKICRDFKPTDLPILNRINEIVVSNLELHEIELELYNLANEIMVESKPVAFRILQTLDRLYE